MGNVQIVRSLVDRINARELDSLGDLVDNNIVAHYGSGPAITGVDELVNLFGDADRVVLASFSGLVATVEDVAEAEDRVGFRYTLRGDAERGGDAVTVGGAAICRISDGRITTMWVVTDRTSFESQMTVLDRRA